jgi:hypothetical protein
METTADCAFWRKQTRISRIFSGRVRILPLDQSGAEFFEFFALCASRGTRQKRNPALSWRGALRLRRTPYVNTRKERNDDDDIDALHPNCRVFDRSRNQYAWRQTLARDLSLETNVTCVTPPSQ